MPVKHFVVNPYVEYQDKIAIEESRKENEVILKKRAASQKEDAIKKLYEEDNLTHVEGRVVIKIDLNYKDSHTFENGITIERPRRFNNLNIRETNPVNAIVISGEGIKKGAEILIHPNAVHDSNRIFDYKDSVESIRYYSIHNDMCFAWHDGKEWKPIPPFALALNVFEKYSGSLIGIEPKQISDTLFVLDGELKGKVVKTISYSAYIVVFQDITNREGRIIRFRPFGQKDREPEAICIMEKITDKVLGGKLLIGIDVSDAKPIQEYYPNKDHKLWVNK